jgi:hypothetical protein
MITMGSTAPGVVLRNIYLIEGGLAALTQRANQVVIAVRRQLGAEAEQGRQASGLGQPAPAFVDLVFECQSTSALDGCQPCRNVPRRHSHVNGRTPSKFAVLTTYSQLNSSRRPLSFRQKCSQFKRQSDSRYVPGARRRQALQSPAAPRQAEAPRWREAMIREGCFHRGSGRGRFAHRPGVHVGRDGTLAGPPSNVRGLRT